MLKRDDSSRNKKVYALSSKFNTILEEVIAGDKRSHYLKVAVDLSSTNFDRWGNITSAGKIEFWKFVDETMKKFNRGITDLKPRPVQCTQSSHHHNKDFNRYKWINLKHRY